MGTENENGNDDYNWASIIYISCFSGLFVPFFNIIIPYLLWVGKKGKSEFLDAHAKNILNFQISITFLVLLLVLLALGCRALGDVFMLFYISICLLVSCLFLYNIAIIILGANAAKQGEAYTISYSLKILK